MSALPTSRLVTLPCLLCAVLSVAGCEEDPPAQGGDASVLRDGSTLEDGGVADEGTWDDQGTSPDAAGAGDTGVTRDAGATADVGAAQDQGGGTGSGLAELLDAETWEEMFPNANALYTHAALVAAAEYYPAFASTGTLAQRRRELAAFLANIAHETTGGWPTAPGGAQAWGLYFIEEVGCEGGACTGYCDAGNVTYPCAPGRTYHGRGPIQLSWNYNYGQVGAVLGLDLLNTPSLVTSDGVVAFRTALWFWMTAQSPKPSAHAVMTGGWTPSAGDVAAGRTVGFGMTINIINGGLECQQPTNTKVQDRVAFFQRFTTMLGTTTGDNLYCDQMQHY